MKDLLTNYIIVSADCTGYFIYTEFYPKIHPGFISYNTPLISTLIWENDHFLKLCERYDYYTSLPLTVVPVLHSFLGPTDTILDDIRVQLTHENEYAHVIDNPQTGGTSKKWSGRTELGKNKIKIFLWSVEDCYRTPYSSEEERRTLLERFKKLDGYSIFLTDRKEEEFEDEFHLIKCYIDLHEIWRSRPSSGNIHLQTTIGLVPLFKELMERKVP